MLLKYSASYVQDELQLAGGVKMVVNGAVVEYAIFVKRTMMMIFVSSKTEWVELVVTALSTLL
jgi:hypothetical protein